MSESPRIAVTGGRDFDSRDIVYARLDRTLVDYPDMVLVHGACKTGADRFADDWAGQNGVPREPFPGPRRNREMAQSGLVLCLAFPGGAGTANMVAECEEAGVPVTHCDENSPLPSLTVEPRLHDKDGKAVQVSHSTLSSRDLCPRRAWYNKHDKLRSPSTEAQKCGSDVHLLVEHYLRKLPPPTVSEEYDYSGTWTDNKGVERPYIMENGLIDPDAPKPDRHLPLDDRADGMFQELLPYLPQPGTVLAERWCGFEVVPGVYFRGKIDTYRLDMPSGLPFVGDVKTRSRIYADYVPDEWQLAVDEQLSRYCYALLHKNPPERVDMVHFNVQRKPPVQADMVVARVDEERGVPWSYIQRVADETAEKVEAMIEEWDGAVTANDIPHNAPGACNAYFTLCEYAGVCPASPTAAKRKLDAYLAQQKEKTTGGPVKKLSFGKPKAKTRETAEPVAPPPAEVREDPPLANVPPPADNPPLAPVDRVTGVTEAQEMVRKVREAGGDEKQVDALLAKLNISPDHVARAKGTPYWTLGYDKATFDKLTPAAQLRVEAESLAPGDVDFNAAGDIVEETEPDAPAETQTPAETEPDAPAEITGPPAPTLDDAPWRFADDEYRKAVMGVTLALVNSESGALSYDRIVEIAKAKCGRQRTSASFERDVIENLEKCGIIQDGDVFVRLEEPAVATEPEPAPEPAQQAAPEPAPEPAQQAAPSLSNSPTFVYVDCLPDTANRPTSFDRWILPHVEAVEKATGGFYALPDYNEGEKQVVARAVALCKQHGNAADIWPNGLYVRTATYLGKLMVEALARFDDLVFVRVAR